MDRSQSGVNGSDAVFPVHQLPNEFLNDPFVDFLHILELWKRLKKELQIPVIVQIAVGRKVFQLAMSHERREGIWYRFLTNSVDLF